MNKKQAEAIAERLIKKKASVYMSNNSFKARGVDLTDVGYKKVMTEFFRKVAEGKGHYTGFDQLYAEEALREWKKEKSTA